MSKDDVPAPTEEANIGAVRQIFGHNSQALSAYTHHKSDPGPGLAGQYLDTVALYYHRNGTTPGLHRVTWSIHLDHAKFGIKTAVDVDCVLSEPHPLKKPRTIDPEVELSFFPLKEEWQLLLMPGTLAFGAFKI